MRDPKLFAPELSALAQLATLTDHQIEQLCKALEAAPPRVSSRRNFIQGVASVEGIERERQDAIVWAIAHLGAYAGGSQGVTRDLILAVRNHLVEQEVSPSDADQVRMILPRLLAVTSIRLRSKAAYLRTDHARAFKRARVLTDLRPVFGLDESTRIEGGVVMHTLKLEYYQDDFARDFFVMLDDLDLETLRVAVARAQEKAKALRATMENCITDFSREGGEQ